MPFHDDFLKQRSRLREALDHYRRIGPAGWYGARMIEQALARADEAILDGDVRRMCASYLEMERFGNGVCWRIEARAPLPAPAPGNDHAAARAATTDWRCDASACA